MSTVAVLVEAIGGPKRVVEIDIDRDTRAQADTAARAVGKELTDEDGSEKPWKLFAPTPKGGFAPAPADYDWPSVVERMTGVAEGAAGFAGPGRHEGQPYLFRVRLFVPGAPPPRRAPETAPIEDEEALDLTDLSALDESSESHRRVRETGRNKAPRRSGAANRHSKHASATGRLKNRDGGGSSKKASTGRIKKPGGGGRQKKANATGRIKKGSVSGRIKRQSATGRIKRQNATGRIRTPSATGRVKKHGAAGHVGEPGSAGRVEQSGSTGAPRQPTDPGQGEGPRASANGSLATPSPAPHPAPAPAAAPPMAGADSRLSGWDDDPGDGATRVGRPPSAQVPGVLPGPLPGPAPAKPAGLSRVVETPALAASGPIRGAQPLTQSPIERPPTPAAPRPAPARQPAPPRPPPPPAPPVTPQPERPPAPPPTARRTRSGGAAPGDRNSKGSPGKSNTLLYALAGLLLLGALVVGGLMVGRGAGGDEPDRSDPPSLADVVAIAAYPTGATAKVVDLRDRYEQLGTSSVSDLEQPAQREALRRFEREAGELCAAGGSFAACDLWARTAFLAFRACYSGDCGQGVAAGYFLNSLQATEACLAGASDVEVAARADASRRLGNQALRLVGQNARVVQARSPQIAAVAQRACESGLAVRECTSQ